MDHPRIPRQALHWEVPRYKRFRSSAYKLEEDSQQGLVKDGNHLGGSRGGSSIVQSGVWPNTSTWMRVESRSRSRSRNKFWGAAAYTLLHTLGL